MGVIIGLLVVLFVGIIVLTIALVQTSKKLKTAVEKYRMANNQVATIKLKITRFQNGLVTARAENSKKPYMQAGLKKAIAMAKELDVDKIV